MTDDLPLMKHTVEQFIQDVKGRRIKIVFDNPMNLHRHIKLLTQAYDIAQAYYNKRNKS